MKSIFKIMACNLNFNVETLIIPGMTLGSSQGHGLELSTFNHKENSKEKLLLELDKKLLSIINNIEKWTPDIINLQQAGIFKLQDNSLLDLVQRIIIALKKKNINYEAIIENQGIFKELKSYNKEKIKYKDRNVILINKKTSAKVLNSVARNYETSLEGKNFHKACCYIDLEKNLHRMRIISSVLDNKNLEINLEEEKQLIQSSEKKGEAIIIITNFINNHGKTFLDKCNLIKVNNNSSSLMYNIPWEDIQVERKFIKEEDSLILTLESENLLC